MKNYILMFILSLFLGGCVNNNEEVFVNSNAEQIFGTIFSPEQDWCSTESREITLAGLDVDSVQILALINEELKILNSVKYCENEKIYFDAPKGVNIFICTIKDGKQYFYLLDDIIRTRSLTRGITIPTNTPEITGTVESYAKKRGYPGFENEVLYTTNISAINAEGYNEVFSTIFRAVVFTYLPNGRKYNNLPKILSKGYYNNDCYAVTTGKEPIIVSMVYKNDGGYKEVETGELYYYYFKGNKTVDEIKALPKYKALNVSECMSADDVINKKYSYVLAYFDGETPTYQFPSGYKIGFMLKMNFKDDVKKGELYFDGRLNSDINRHGHFASSGLGSTDPRMCWISVNKKMFMCCEAGTDSDFNDAVFEIEGGIEPIDIPIDPEFNFYTFLFEDRNLGDYDMNDVVLRGTRLSDTKVKWEVVATGAYDELYINNIKGKIINSSKEIHSYFGVEQQTYVNVGKGVNKPIVSETLNVNKEFSFLNNMPFITNVTQETTIYLATSGQNPHAIMIPYAVKWPIERICIKDAYLEFNTWGKNPIISTDWYTRPVEEKVVQ